MVSPHSPFQESFRNNTIINSIDNAPQNERKKTAFSSPFRSALLIRQRRIYPYAFLENLLILAATETPIPPSRGDRRWGNETENRKHARVTSAGDEEERPESNRHSAPPRRNHAMRRHSQPQRSRPLRRATGCQCFDESPAMRTAANKRLSARMANPAPPSAPGTYAFSSSSVIQLAAWMHASSSRSALHF